MRYKKNGFQISDEKLKIINNAEFVKVVKKEPGNDDVYVPITRNGKKFYLIIQK
jgi:hypothetical protein